MEPRTIVSIFPLFGATFPSRVFRMGYAIRMVGIWLAAIAGILCAEEPAKPSASPAPKSELTTLTAFHKAELDEISKEYEKWFAALQTWYLGGLDKLFSERTKAGDLDGAVAIRAERERIAARTESTAGQIQAMPPLLAKLRAAYDPAKKRIDDEAARRISAARVKYAANLEALQKQLTMKSDLDQAMLVRDEKNRVTAEIAKDASAAPAPTIASVPPMPQKPQATPLPAAPKPTPSRMGSLEGSDLSNPQRDLLAPELADRWLAQRGTWRVENGVLFGEGDSSRVYRHAQTLPFTLKFKINVREGTRPRVKFGAFTFANEGPGTTFGLYPKGEKELFHYEHNTEYNIAIEVTRQDATLKVNDAVVATHILGKEKFEKIEFCAGDDWSKGRTEFRDISISK